LPFVVRVRVLIVTLAIAAFAGCASSPPPQPISVKDRQRFQATVAAARQIGTSWECPRGDAQLRAAESDFYYAENSPMDRARAKQMAAQAQKEAEAALAQCRVETAYRRLPASSKLADGR
jgi:hypothetical protein